MEKNKTPRQSPMYFITSGIVLFALCLLSLRLGSVYIPWRDFFTAVFVKDNSTYSLIIHSMRIPETAGALLAGAGLGISGLLLQRVTDNKMASPNLIGVSQGAGFGVMVLLYFFPSLYRVTPVFAFCGAFISVLLITALSRKIGLTRSGVVLVGLAFGSVLSAGISFISMLDSDVLVSYNAFSVGSLSNVPLKQLFVPFVMIMCCFITAMLISEKCDLMMLGDNVASSLGVRVSRTRILLMLLAGLSSGAVVSFAGLLGFVGLMSPHIARFFVKENFKVLLPASAVTGSGLVLLSHIVSKIAFAPSNVPVGIVLSAGGAVFFLVILLLKGDKGNA